MIIDEDVYLEHFGIKGMRWGVITDYKTNRRNKAKENDDRAEGYQKQIDVLKTKPTRFGTKRSTKNKIKDLEEDRDKEFAISKALREGKWTSNQKKAALGVSVAATILAVAGTYVAKDSGEFNRIALKGKDFLAGKDQHAWKKDLKLSSDMNMPDLQALVVEKINPDYGERGTMMNCRRATFAYEMRRRGNDVKATKSTLGAGQQAGGLRKALTKDKKARLTGLFKDVNHLGKETINLNKGESVDTSIFNALMKQPKGARGELTVDWQMGGGHSLAWEMIKGKPVIVDGQSGQIYENAKDFTKIASAVQEARFTRLDNIELNNNYLMRWLKDA